MTDELDDLAEAEVVVGDHRFRAGLATRGTVGVIVGQGEIDERRNMVVASGDPLVEPLLEVVEPAVRRVADLARMSRVGAAREGRERAVAPEMERVPEVLVLVHRRERRATVVRQTSGE